MQKKELTILADALSVALVQTLGPKAAVDKLFDVLGNEYNSRDFDKIARTFAKSLGVSLDYEHGDSFVDDESLTALKKRLVEQLSAISAS